MANKIKIFLTGGSGFIGSHYLANMAHHDCNITAVRRPGSQARIPLPREPAWLVKPLDKLQIEDLSGHDVLVHLASTGVSPQQATWQELFYWNVNTFVRLLDIAYQAGIRRIVAAGSFAEYGKSSENYEFIPVDAPLQPTSAYAASKAAASVAALAFAQTAKIELCYLRIFSAYGPGQHEENFWPSLRNAALSGKDFPMTPGAQVRDYVPVETVAKMIHFATYRPDIKKGKPKVTNVGSGLATTMLDFAKHWWAIWNASGRLLPGALPYREGESMRFVPQLDESENLLLHSTHLPEQYYSL